MKQKIVIFIVVFLCFINIPVVKASNNSTTNFINWFNTHETTGGTFTLTSDIIFGNDSNISKYYFISTYGKTFTINMNGYSFYIMDSVDNPTYVEFSKSNFYFTNSKTVFYVDYNNPNSEFYLQKSTIKTTGDNAITINKGSISSIYGEGENSIEALNGTGIITHSNQQLSLSNFTIQALTAINSQGTVTLNACYIDGYIVAPTINLLFSVIKEASCTPNIVDNFTFASYNSGSKQDTSSFYISYNTNISFTEQLLPNEIVIYAFDKFNDTITSLYIPLAYKNLNIDENLSEGSSFIVTSEFVITPLLQSLIDEQRLSLSNLNPPTIKVTIVPKTFSISLTPMYFFHLTTYTEFLYPTGVSNIEILLSKDKNTWYQEIANPLAQVVIPYRDVEDTIVALGGNWGNPNNMDERLKIELNQTYYLKVVITGGIYDGVDFIAPLVVNADTINIPIEYTFSVNNTGNTGSNNPNITQKPAIDGSSDGIEGNRGGGGQTQTKRDINNGTSLDNENTYSSDNNEDTPVTEDKDILFDSTIPLSKTENAIFDTQNTTTISSYWFYIFGISSLLLIIGGILFYKNKSN